MPCEDIAIILRTSITLILYLTLELSRAGLRGFEVFCRLLSFPQNLIRLTGINSVSINIRLVRPWLCTRG